MDDTNSVKSWSKTPQNEVEYRREDINYVTRLGSIMDIKRALQIQQSPKPINLNPLLMKEKEFKNFSIQTSGPEQFMNKYKLPSPKKHKKLDSHNYTEQTESKNESLLKSFGQLIHSPLSFHGKRDQARKKLLIEDRMKMEMETLKSKQEQRRGLESQKYFPSIYNNLGRLSGSLLGQDQFKNSISVVNLNYQNSSVHKNNFLKEYNSDVLKIKNGYRDMVNRTLRKKKQLNLIIHNKLASQNNFNF